METNHECKDCGKPFAPTCHTTRQMFCSKECRIKNNNAMRYVPPDNACLECGASLEQSGQRGRNRKFCGEVCKKAHHAKKMLEKKRIRHTYACRHCERHNDHVPIVRAPMSNPVIKGSFASPDAIAHIACEKFVMGSPLYRQEQDWARKGIPLSRQTISSWLIHATKDWLFLLYDALKAKLLEHEVLHSDETIVQVLHEPGKAPQSKRYMWMYRTSGDARHSIVLYEYQPSRHARHPKAFLQDFHGFLHADGYEGYHDLPQDISVVGCWAHVRRKFDEALKAIPASAQANSPPMEAIKQIGQLYKLEGEFQKLSQMINSRRGTNAASLWLMHSSTGARRKTHCPSRTLAAL